MIGDGLENIGSGLINMTTCAQFKKVTVITDPLNPELDLLSRATDYGKVVHQEICGDGFVYLIRINDEVAEEVSAVIE